MSTPKSLCCEKIKGAMFVMENKVIGERIKKRRKELNLTQQQIKAATGISTGNMSEIENGSKLPSTPALISLSNVLDCSIDWILKGDSLKREIYVEDKLTAELIDGFNLLSEEEQEEFMDILRLKLKKMKKEKNRNLESSALITIDNTNMVG